MDVTTRPSKSQQEERTTKNTDKSKMLDITRDKPVKVAVKVAVPVRDHPKFNFVGKLLGPKGNSMKRLQEDTMCKMAVLGRGSMRDRKKEEELRASGDCRYAHLFEDLHVEISTFAAPAEAHARIAYALAEVRRFLVPDYHDDIRQEQMWEMQALTSSPTVSNQSGDQQSPKHGIGGIRVIADINSPTGKVECENDGVDHLPGDRREGLQLKTKSHTHLYHLLSNDAHGSAPNGEGVMTMAGANSISASANATSPMAVALQHQFASAGIGGILKPVAGVTTVAGLAGLSATHSAADIPMNNDGEATAANPTFTLLDSTGGLLHPALRGVKAINIATGLGRKRPLLGVPRSGINPTKRTVMTLLARAKNSQSLHAIRNPMANSVPNFAESLQMLASPYILHPHQPVDQSMITQGV